MMYLYLVLLWLLVAYSGAGHSAEVYKWVDEDGKVYFSDSPPSDDVNTEKIRPPPAPSKDNIRRTQARTDLLIEQQRASAYQRAQEREEKQIAEAERIEELCANAHFGVDGTLWLHESRLKNVVDRNGKVRKSAAKKMFRDIAANCR